MKSVMWYQKTLPFLLLMVPCLFCCQCYCLGVRVYLPQLKLSLPTHIFPHMVMGGSLFWLNIESIRAVCRKNILSETAFYLMPVLTVSALIFAQWHFGAVAIVLLLILAAALFLFCPLFRGKRWKCLVQPAARSRCFITIAAALLLIPAGTAAFSYELRGPTYSVSQELWESLSGQDEQSVPTSDAEDLFTENHLLLQQFRPEQWSTLSLQEKTDLFQHLVSFECKRFAIPVLPITVETLDPEIQGQYRSEDEIIICNLAFLNDAPVEAVLRTAAHECHHAYTYFLASQTDWSAPVSSTLYFSQARIWRENYENYIHHNDYDRYLAQPVEADANAWAEQELRLIQECWDE